MIQPTPSLLRGPTARFGLAEAPTGKVEDRPLVIVESPYFHKDPVEFAKNIEFAQKAMLDAMMHGYAPMLTHLLHTQVTDDTNAEQRDWSIKTSLAWRRKADKSIVYTDRGISSGMRYGIQAAEEAGNPVEYHELKTCPNSPAVERLYSQNQGKTLFPLYQAGQREIAEQQASGGRLNRSA